MEQKKPLQIAIFSLGLDLDIVQNTVNILNSHKGDSIKFKHFDLDDVVELLDDESLKSEIRAPYENIEGITCTIFKKKLPVLEIIQKKLSETHSCDYVVAITPNVLFDTLDEAQISLRDDNKSDGYFFDDNNKDCAIVSLYHLEEFSKKTDRALPICLCTLIIEAVVGFLTTLDPEKAHLDPSGKPTSIGCLMDYCDTREEALTSFSNFKFCPSCTKEILKNDFGKYILDLTEYCKNYSSDGKSNNKDGFEYEFVKAQRPPYYNPSLGMPTSEEIESEIRKAKDSAIPQMTSNPSFTDSSKPHSTPSALPKPSHKKRDLTIVVSIIATVVVAFVFSPYFLDVVYPPTPEIHVTDLNAQDGIIEGNNPVYSYEPRTLTPNGTKNEIFFLTVSNTGNGHAKNFWMNIDYKPDGPWLDYHTSAVVHSGPPKHCQNKSSHCTIELITKESGPIELQYSVSFDHKEYQEISKENPKLFFKYGFDDSAENTIEIFLKID